MKLMVILLGVLCTNWSRCCLKECKNLVVKWEWLTGAFCLIQRTLLNPYANVAMQILVNTSRKVPVLLETNEWIPAVVSWGFYGLLVKKGMDIVLRLIHWKNSLQTMNQFISLRVGTFFRFSHYFSSLSLSIFISQALALHQTTSPPSPSVSQSVTPLASFIFLSQTHVCSLSVILNAPFPEHGRMPEMETKRLWYKLVFCWQCSFTCT